MANHLKNLCGQKFGRWTVVSLAPRSPKATMWNVRCDCGTLGTVSGGNLRNGKTLSCGCLVADRNREQTHSRSFEPLALTGKKFGRWLVLARADGRKWLCECECGNQNAVNSSNLQGGRSLSCGCLQKERASQGSLKHGMSAHPIYLCWTRIRNRCFNANDEDFHHYGGRGITVCDRWKDDFDAFNADMGPTWKCGLSIERNDVNGNYESSNCRWATQREQTRNRRNTVYVDSPWGRIPLVEAAERSGLGHQTIRNRIKSGWPEEKWLLPPV